MESFMKCETKTREIIECERILLIQILCIKRVKSQVDLNFCQGTLTFLNEWMSISEFE